MVHPAAWLAYTAWNLTIPECIDPLTTPVWLWFRVGFRIWWRRQRPWTITAPVSTITAGTTTAFRTTFHTECVTTVWCIVFIILQIISWWLLRIQTLIIYKLVCIRSYTLFHKAGILRLKALVSKLKAQILLLVSIYAKAVSLSSFSYIIFNLTWWILAVAAITIRLFASAGIIGCHCNNYSSACSRKLRELLTVILLLKLTFYIITELIRCSPLYTSYISSNPLIKIISKESVILIITATQIIGITLPVLLILLLGYYQFIPVVASSINNKDSFIFLSLCKQLRFIMLIWTRTCQLYIEEN